MQYDIIGDIHGHADKLEALLARLGYCHHLGAWRHPSRQAIFVGDFIDRGLMQVATVSLVRRMVEAGSALAIMGNHEFNAIGWFTPDPDRPAAFLRPHSSKNREQHIAFLREVEGRSDLHKDLIDWFMTLPLWIELPELRVVHACWHPASVEFLAPRLTADHQFPQDHGFLREAFLGPKDECGRHDADPTVFGAVEALTKGIEIALPQDMSFLDKDHIVRHHARLRWWDVDAVLYSQALLLDSEIVATLPSHPIPASARIDPPTDRPIFFGHYWMHATQEAPPQRQAPMFACVDYSAAKGGPLVAYRFEGESEIVDAHFVQADA